MARYRKQNSAVETIKTVIALPFIVLLSIPLALLDN